MCIIYVYKIYSPPYLILGLHIELSLLCKEMTQVCRNTGKTALVVANVQRAQLTSLADIAACIMSVHELSCSW